MTVNDTFTSLYKTMRRGGWSFSNPKIGVVEAEIATDLAVAANDVIAAIYFEAATVVLSAWAEVVNATTGSCNMSIGKADGAELMDATAINSTGIKFGITTYLPVLFDAADTLDCHFSASAAGGDVRVRAVVVDAQGQDVS